MDTDLTFRSVLNTAILNNRRVVAEGFDIEDAADPRFCDGLTEASLVTRYINMLASADAKAFDTAVAVGGAATVATVVGIAVGAKVSWKDSMIAGDGRMFTMTLAYTTPGGVAVSQAFTVNPHLRGPKCVIYIPFMELLGARPQPSICTAAGYTITVAADTIRDDSMIQSTNFVTRDLQ